jgi:hypothetical protein
MFHLVWYVLIGLVSGVIAKSVMHVHIRLFWSVVLASSDRSWAAALPTCFRAQQMNDIIPPASFYPHLARFWFSSFAIN